MRKRQVRCYSGYANVGTVANVKVYFTFSEAYDLRLFSCLSCGEIFVIDYENPGLHNKSYSQVAVGQLCPRCGSNLGSVLSPYPDQFYYLDGKIGEFEKPRIIPNDNESEVREFFEIEDISETPLVGNEA